MPKPRTPTNVLEARGAFEKNPQRRGDRAGEPRRLIPLEACPVEFTAQERRCWDEIVAACPKGVLTNADRVTVELAAVLLAEARENYRAFASGRMSQLARFLSLLGMTPTERSKISVVGDEEERDDPAAKFRGR